MAFPLLSTKFYIPPAGPALVARPRLLKSFDLALGRPLTLVSAPPGFGKTTLVASWIAQRRGSPGGLGQGHDPGGLGQGHDPGGSGQDESPEPRFCWLSLDPADNDPSRFWIYVAAALAKNARTETAVRQDKTAGMPASSPSLGEILNLLQANPLPALEPFLDTLINILDSLGIPLVLVLDDYHLVQAAPIHQGMSYLVEHLPPQIHLVILTRVDPPLPLHRLRARGQLHELRAADLRFTPPETIELLERLTGLNLPAEDVVMLAESTEGWAAGLQMAALAFQAQSKTAAGRPENYSPGGLSQGHDPGGFSQGDLLHNFIAGFSGKHHYILDYLAEEVFNRQPAPIQAFLLQTSILERMCASLCAAITGLEESSSVNAAPSLEEGSRVPPAAALAPASRDSGAAPSASGTEPDARSILDYLERSNLFLVPLDEERQWYRYHHLFADLLRARLRQAMPSLLPPRTGVPLAMQPVRAGRPAGRHRPRTAGAGYGPRFAAGVFAARTVAELHTRASIWFEANGWSGEAISHALAGEDWEHAARLMEQNVQDFVARGRLAEVMGWIEALPPQVAHNRPGLGLELAWALTVASQVQKAAPYIQDAEAALDAWQAALTQEAAASAPPSGTLPEGAPLDPDEVGLIRGFITVMRAFAGIMSGDRAGALAQAQAALAVLPAGPSRQRAFLNWVAGFASRSLGEMDQAYSYHSEAAHIAQQSWRSWTGRQPRSIRWQVGTGRQSWRLGPGRLSCNFLEIMVLLSEYGITCWLMGRLSQAVELFREALQVGAESGVPNHGYLSRVESYYSAVLLEQNDVEGALRHARTSVEYASWWPSANHTTTAFTYLGRALQAAGSLDGAVEAYRRAEAEAQQGPVLEGVRSELEIRIVCLWLAQNDLEAAVRWADDFSRSPEAHFDAHQPPADPQASRLVTLGRVRLAQHQHAPQGDEAALAQTARTDALAVAVELLEALAQAARAAGRTHALIEIQVLLAAGLYYQAVLSTSSAARAAALERALMAIDSALQLGQPESYVRVFLEGGEPVESLLHQRKLLPAGHWPEGGINPAYLEKLLAAFTSAAPQQAVSQARLPEPLTGRELEVLRLLALGLSNSEIARQLVVSEGTVKTHVHNLIGKLDARGRSHAVALARELKLL